MTQIGAYENQDLELFDYGRSKKESWVSGFLFSVRKQKTVTKKYFFTKSRFGTTMAGKTAKKHPESHLGLISVDLTLSGQKLCRFMSVSACSGSHQRLKHVFHYGYLKDSKFRTKSRYFTDNSAEWNLATNSFHQHVRLLMKISPHTFFRKKYFDPMEKYVFQ